MEFVIYIILSVLISTVTLVISMFIFSALLGSGFGEAKQAILKGAGLILVVNLVWLIPVPLLNAFLALVVWLVGLMVLFELDWREAIALALINMVVNWITAFILAAILLTALGPGDELSAAAIVRGFLA